MAKSKRTKRYRTDEVFVRDLALSYLKRADESANYLRTLLVALNAGVVSFAVADLPAQPTSQFINATLIAVILLAVSMSLLVWSWQVQKKKAGERFKVLRARLMDGSRTADYAEQELKIENSFWLRNYRTDWIAFGLIVGGFLMELVARIYFVA